MSGLEHRSHFRPPSPMPRLVVRMDIMMETLAKKKRLAVMAYGSWAALVLLCLAVLGWSVMARLPYVNVSGETLKMERQLNRQLSQLQGAWSAGDAAHLAKSLKAQQQRMFADSKAVVAWLVMYIQHADQQQIALTYQLGAVRPALVGNHALPISLKFRPEAGMKGRAYANMVRFALTMVRDAPWVQVGKSTMVGNRVQASDLKLSVTALMRQP
ncbi:MAG: hypothetical protein Q9M26_08615 [Mariprofundales bacterium]|nr:hypothetical protein [Mariprofundales bacterium]